MENKNLNANAIINEVHSETISFEKSKKNNTKKIIVKTVVVVLTSFLAFFALVWGIVMLTGNGGIKKIDDKWVEFRSGTDAGLYGYKEAPDEFVNTLKEISHKYAVDNGTEEDFSSLTYLNKREYENYVRYYYTYPTWNDTLGYFIDYDGTYILEVGAVITAELDNIRDGDTLTTVLFGGVPPILYAYGLEITTIDELSAKVLKEIQSKANFPEKCCRYGDFVISYYYDENAIRHLSVFRVTDERLRNIEKEVGYTLVDVSKI